MCTINMTFEVPETRHINIEAPRLSQRLRGIAKSVPADFDYKKELESRN